MNDLNSDFGSHHRFRILVVDDDDSFRGLLDQLFGERYSVALASNGEEAIAVAPDFQPDIILLDIHMSGIDGFEACRQLKLLAALQPAQIVMISANSSWEEQVRAFSAGADDYAVKPIRPEAFFARIQLHLQLQMAKSELSSIKSKNRSYQLEHRQLLEERVQEQENSRDIVVFTLAEVADSRDEVTGQHLVRIKTYSKILAERLQESGPYRTIIDDQFVEDLYRSSPLHDIGKMGIPDGILLKPGPLTAHESNLMKQHTVIGANILDGAIFRSRFGGFLAMASVIARFHHERWDGSGYPAGLEGEEIPLPARIVAVADVYDALTSARPYRQAIAPLLVKATIEAEAGRHFDPAIIAAFQDSFEDFQRAQNEHFREERCVTGAMAFSQTTL